MADMTNEGRSEMAAHALSTFADDAGLALPEERREAISDLIANLCHHARFAGLEPLEIVEGAFGVFLAEEFDERDLAEEPKVCIVWDLPKSWKA